MLQRNLCGNGLEPSVDERDLASDAGCVVMDVAAPFQKIADILVRQRIPQVPAHGTKDDLTGKAVVLERRLPRHAQPQKNATPSRTAINAIVP